MPPTDIFTESIGPGNPARAKFAAENTNEWNKIENCTLVLYPDLPGANELITAQIYVTVDRHAQDWNPVQCGYHLSAYGSHK